jgi:hypothetical protein
MDIPLISCNREYFGESYMPSGPWWRQGWPEMHCVGVVTPKKQLDNQVVRPLLCLPFVINHHQELVSIVPERTKWTSGEAQD